MKASRDMRHRFYRWFFRGLGVVWPIVSGLMLVMGTLGLLIAKVEGWPLGEGLYFSFVTGLTIGYGDLVPKHELSRILAIAIGFAGIVMAGLIAAVGVQALHKSLGREEISQS